jgi:hypothetical protein
MMSLKSSHILAMFAACLTVASAQAQYFGQNKVRYRTLDFKVLKTDHFDIYYYEEASEAAVQVGRMAERWYERLSNVLEYDLSSRQPFILYASHPDFRGTTAIPGYIGETTGGVTEALRRRLVMPLAGPLAETDHVLGHELVHAFQFDISTRPGPMAGSGLPGVLRLPLWFVEGMAEYLSLGPVDPHTAMWMRDAVRRDAIPPIRRLDRPEYFPYRYGQAFWAFVAGRYGDQVVGRILKAAGRTGSAEGAITSVLDITIDALSEQWRDALLDEYEPVLKATTAPQEQATLLVSKERHGGDLNVSPVLSPDGKWMIFFSEKDLFSIDLFLADAQTGQIRRKITETAVDPHSDSLQFVNSAGAWGPDSRQVAFGSISRGRPELSIYDVTQDRITRRIRFPELGEIYTPAWSPDGRRIAFSAIAQGVTDLFIVDLDSEQLRQVTDDAYADLQPAWSPDGRWIALVTDRFTSDLSVLSSGHYRLALADPATGEMEPVPGFGDGKHTNPQWGRDGQSLYFLSDRDGISNIYRLARQERRIYQVTNVQTGISGISQLSPAFSVAAEADRLVFSAFLGGNYSIFGMDSPTALAGQPPTEALAGLTAGILPPGRRTAGPVVTMLDDPRGGLVPPEFQFTEYRPSLALDYIAPPQISVGMSSFGSLIGGGTALYFSDLLGYHNLMTAFQTSTTSEAGNFLNNLSAIAAYQNQRRRWTWGLIGGQVPFLTGGYSTGLGQIGGQPVVVEQAVTFWQIDRELAGLLAYPFNRAQRVEFTGGFRSVGFDAQATTQIFSAVTGQLLLRERQKIPTPDSIHMGTASTALVYDTSIFGGTSPIMGERYRLEAGAVGGGLNHGILLADYRRYLRVARPLTLAGRVLHYGRYGGDAEDPRLQDLFVGFPSLVRGYSPGSFTVQECGPAVAETGACPVFDQLLGSRMGVINAELRVPIFGFLGIVPSRSAPPVEAALFYDAGIAWTRAEKANFLGGPRKPVSSSGISLRANVLGFAIAQISYVHALDRPAKRWLWEFSLLPGF